MESWWGNVAGGGAETMGLGSAVELLCNGRCNCVVGRWVAIRNPAKISLSLRTGCWPGGTGLF